MKDTFEALKLYRKETRSRNNDFYTPLLLKAGAKFLTDGVYRLGDWDCYSGRGYARNWKTGKTTSIKERIKNVGN